jgi:ATP-dependent helicase HepA
MPHRLRQRVRHRFNPDLGLGRVIAVEGRELVVEFPAVDTVLRLAASTDALQPLEFVPGARAHLAPDDEPVLVDTPLGDATVRLADGRVVAEDDLWPVEAEESWFEHLAEGRVDALEDVVNRLGALELNEIRQADGLGSFLGGRIRIFPHQLHVAERATRSHPVRWLLADEVGLGKTVEACLILNHLVHTREIERTLVVAPETLTVQWLGELWRKYHQVFVLLDEKRLADVRRDYGDDFNPFDAHRQVVLGLDMLTGHPRLTEQAVAAGVDLLVVDEAHHLRRPPGHPGNAEYRAIAPITRAAPHVLLLTATPLEEDAHGFFRLLQLLRPEELSGDGFEERLARREPLPPCTSATRRADVGGLPPRQPHGVDIEDPGGWGALARLQEQALGLEASNAVAARRKADVVWRATASPASVAAVVDRNRPPWATLLEQAEGSDPRVEWLAGRGRAWRDRDEKTLVFVAHRESLEMLRAAMSRLGQVRTGVFHEDLSPTQRDIEVAQFRMESGPSMLVSTECGGEGRNFEFCHRLVLFDLPWNPLTVEQRIGRLDRIGRDRPVEIVYFRPPGGLGRSVVELYEGLGLFREALGSLERELEAVPEAIRQRAVAGQTGLEPHETDALIDEARTGADRIRTAAYHELHREPYTPQIGRALLARVPRGLEELTEEVVVGACERLGMHVERQRGEAVYGVEFGNHATVDHLPGVPGGSNFLGTFDRVEGVARETIDFFASGHALVEGVLAQLDESARGRVGLVHVTRAELEEETFAVAGIYRKEGRVEIHAVDLTGARRPDLAARLAQRPLRSRRVRASDWTAQRGWAALIRRLAEKLAGYGRPEVVLAIRVSPQA